MCMSQLFVIFLFDKNNEYPHFLYWNKLSAFLFNDKYGLPQLALDNGTEYQTFLREREQTCFTLIINLVCDNKVDQ